MENKEILKDNIVWGFRSSSNKKYGHFPYDNNLWRSINRKIDKKELNYICEIFDDIPHFDKYVRNNIMDKLP